MLKGIRVLELEGLAPVPFAGMMLQDHGANVCTILQRQSERLEEDVLNDGKSTMELDLKTLHGKNSFLELLLTADVLLDPYRPGVLDRLGLGDEILLEQNPRMIVAHLTGYGPKHAYAQHAGHDLNFVAMSGVLEGIRRHGQKPVAPLNILGDFAGGGLMCVALISMALFERSRNGQGKVLHVAMVDGVRYVSTYYFEKKARGAWPEEPGKNLLDTGCPFYDVYATKDNRFMAIAPIETRFFRIFLTAMFGKGKQVDSLVDHQFDRSSWPRMRALFEREFRLRTRREWELIFEKLPNCCVTPVLESHEISKEDVKRAARL